MDMILLENVLIEIALFDLYPDLRQAQTRIEKVALQDLNG